MKSYVTYNSVKCVEAIYGTVVPLLKVKNISKQYERIKYIPCVLLMATTLDHTCMVNIYMDSFFVNGNLFFHTNFELIHFLWVQTCKGHRKK